MRRRQSGRSMEAPTNMGRKSQTPEGLSRGCGLRSIRWRGGDGVLGLGKWRVMSDDWRVVCVGWGKSRFLAPLGMTIHVRGLGRFLTGLKTGQDLLCEFGSRRWQGSVRRGGRLWGLGKWRVVSGE